MVVNGIMVLRLKSLVFTSHMVSRQLADTGTILYQKPPSLLASFPGSRVPERGSLGTRLRLYCCAFTA